MSFLGAYVLFFKNYFNFKGRSTRKDYWLVQACHFFIYFILIIGLFQTGIHPLFTLLLVVYTLFIIIPQMSLTIRRFRDAGLSGKWFILLLAMTMIITFLPESFELPKFLKWLDAGLNFIQFYILVLPSKQIVKN
ncbi:MAG: DUF805 domain-containing protein [Turicibacter sp.]|nr:DUF805 domain-containing protein [Turicibacter sp.]